MKKWLKRIGVAVGVLVLLLILSLATIYTVTGRKFARKYDVKTQAVTVANTPENVARGKHLVIAIGKCVDCHGEDLGGKVVIDDPAFGLIAASNLTGGNGGVGSKYSDDQLVRAIRYGIGHDGRGLFFMPSLEYYYFNDEDIGSIVAYLRTLPNVDRTIPTSNPGPLGRALHLGGKVPMLVSAEHTTRFAPRDAAVPPDTTKEYGAYLAMVGGCVGCHGEKLTGGAIPGAPPEWPKAANITATQSGIGNWSEADFARALREGKRPDGRVLSAVMPWPYTRYMTDTELKAVWKYVRTVK